MHPRLPRAGVPGRWLPLVLIPFLALPLGLVGCGSDDNGGVTPEQDGVLYDVAGTQGESGNVGDGGPATEALLYWPIDVTVLPSGELVIADWNNHGFRKINSDGTIHRFIGSGHLGDARTGQALSINFNHPTDLKIGPNGHYYVAAFHNWSIREIDPATGQATTPVGFPNADNPPSGSVRGYSGDNGPANAAKFNLPGAIVFDHAGNLYITDQGNMRIRKVDPNGIVTTLAGSEFGYQDGTGADAHFSFEGDQATTGTGTRSGCIELSPDGNFLYVADTLNNRLRKIEIATGIVTTIAGTGAQGYSGDGGPALQATFYHPSDIACSAAGDIYVSDRYNNVVRKIDTAGIITTIAGTGEKGFSPNGTPATEAKLDNPLGLTYDNATHTLYIADMYNHQVKKVINP